MLWVKGGFMSTAPAFKKCPDCAEEIRAEARKCRFCGFEFPQVEQTEMAQVEPALPRPMKSGRGAKVALGLVVCVLIWAAYVSNRRSAPAPAAAGSTIKQPPAATLTPLQRKIEAELAEVEQEKEAEAALPDRVRRAELGVVTTVVGPGVPWPCAPSKGDLGELMKWRAAMLDEQMPDSVMNSLHESLVRTRSVMVEPRTQVRILEKEPNSRMVSIIDRSKYLGYKAATAQACWVVAEAVTRPSLKR
jgi:hypothetical protein